MKLTNASADCFVPDGMALPAAVARTLAEDAVAL